jgi:hypothetical protein
VAPVSKLPLGTTSTTVAAGNHNHDSSYSKLGHKHNWEDINGVPVYATRWPNYGEVGIKATDIPSISQYLGTADLNTIETPGFYYQTSNANTSAARNYPTTQAGSLLVQKSAGVTQMYTTYSPGGNKVYVRSKYSTSWGSWIELYSTFNKPTLAELGAAAASHTHPWAQVTGVPATATRWPTWTEVTSKPSTFAPSAHNHSGSDITSGTISNARLPSSISVTEVEGIRLGVNNTGSSSQEGISLYAGANTGKPSYGLLFTGTAGNGTHGGVTGDWATYFTMSGANNRGWIFQHAGANVASISSTGVFTGTFSGNASSASSVPWSGVTGKPTTFAPSAHNHSWSQVTGAPATATRWPSWGEVSGKPSSFTPVSHSHSWGDLTGLPKYATRWPVWDEVIGKPNKPTVTKTTLYSGKIAYGGATVYTLAKAWDQFDAIVVIGSHDGGNSPVSSMKTREELQEMYALAGTTKQWELLASSEIFFFWQMVDTSKTKFKITRENGELYKIIGINYSL